MALYEYECPICGTFEILQNINDKPIEKCEKCGSKVEKKISPPGYFDLKGPGFFKNDYKDKK